jgi:hypothetical protein
MIRTQDTAPKVPDHEQIRRDAQEHPERTPSQHADAALRIAARTYVEDLRRLMVAGRLDPEEG